MPSYKAPLRDMRFVLHDYLDLSGEVRKLGNAEATADLIDAVLEEGAKLAEEVLQPINLSGDQEGCRFQNGVVTTPAGFKAAYKTYAEGGWGGLSADPAYGGQGLPRTLAIAISEMSSAANMAFAMYPGLSRGAYAALALHGTEEQKRLYLPKIAAGTWTGTMNLTEPHAGTDLGLIKTRAEPKEDGTYAITGTKIFISAGEHDLADNIVHLVLARIKGAPEGVKGISLFVVPKFHVKSDGTLGPRNGVSCGAIEHKMGIHGNATCVLNYDGAIGTLVGEADKGLRAMFTMMNEARMGVALQGLAQADVAYQNAVIYAKDRLQGRALTGAKDKDKPADPLIHIPDVRRMLMNARALTEGGRALLYWTALRADIHAGSADSAAREAAEDMLGLLTPVLKAYLTDMGFQTAVECQQIYGGHGYIAENGMEQFVRDARIAMIYEGANGIQALDLVGRKLAAHGGRAIFGAFGLIDQLLKETAGNAALKPWTEGLARARKDLEEATQWLMANGLANPENAAAVSTDYLYLLALTMLAASWAGMVATAEAKRAQDAGDARFYERKIKTARYFLTNILPATGLHLERLKAGAAPMLALAPDDF
jgi:alkylation response protein AidB-like acyl-CoA dehydrogenase